MKGVIFIIILFLVLPIASQSQLDDIKQQWEEAEQLGELGNHTNAIQQFDKTLKQCERAAGWGRIADRKDLKDPENGWEFVDLYIDLLGEYVLYLYNYGTYAETEKRFQELTQILLKSYGKEWPYGSILKEFAEFYLKYHQLERAEELLREAEPIFTSTHGTNSPEYGSLLMSKVDLSRAKEELDDGWKLLLEAEAIISKVYGKKSTDYAYLLVTKGDYFLEMGELIMARKSFSRALNIFTKFYDPNSFSRGMALQRLADVEARLFNFDIAIALSREALEIAGQIDEGCLSCEIYNLGSYQFYKGNYTEAYENLKASNDLAIKLYRLNAESMTAAERTSFIEEYDYRWNLFYELLLVRPNIIGLHESAFELSMNLKGMILDQTLRVKSGIMSSEDESLRRLYEQWIDLKQQLAKLYAARDLNQLTIQQVENKAQALEKKLILKSQGFKKTTRESMDWRQIRDQLKEGEAAIEMIRVDALDSISYVALIVKPNIERPILVIFKDGELMESTYFKSYQNSIKFKLSDRKSYQLYWEPIAAHLKGIDKVFLSPDGVYHNISLAGLFDARSESYLIDKQDIQKVISVSEIVQPRESFYWNNRGYLFGYPAYNAGGTLSLEVKKLLVADTAQRFFDGNRIVELPGTFKEVQLLQSKFDSTSMVATVYSHDKASEKNLKRMKSPRLLHIATHGYYIKPTDLNNTEFMMGHNSTELASNPMLRSGLLLANAKEAISNGGDGLLTAYEAMNLNLEHTDLVVLSACETGLGDVKNGEGVFGLQRAFRIAGANSVIMSLWTVSDEATQRFMNLFYDYWLIQNLNRRAAFLAAQRKLREEYAHPYFWAAFIMVGTEGEPLPDIPTTPLARILTEDGWSADNVIINPARKRLVINEFVYGAPHAGRRMEIFDFDGAKIAEVHDGSLTSGTGWDYRVNKDHILGLSFHNRNLHTVSVWDFDGKEVLHVADTTFQNIWNLDVSVDDQLLVGVDKHDYTVLRLHAIDGSKTIKTLRLDEVITGVTVREKTIMTFTPYNVLYFDLDLNPVKETPYDEKLFREAYLDEWLSDQTWTSTFAPPKISRQVYDVIHGFEKGNYLDEGAFWALEDNHILMKRLGTVHVYRIEATDSTYHNDKTIRHIGAVKTFTDGVVYKDIDYRNGKTTRIIYYDHQKGQVARIYRYWTELINNDFVNFQTYVTSYTPEGKRTCYDGQGNYQTYFQDGGLSGDYPITNGLIHGIRRDYHPNGKVSYEATYEQGMRSGTVSWYYPNGQLEDEIIYKPDPNNPTIGLRWTIKASYSQDGKPRDRGTLFEGNGTMINYNKVGEQIKERVFENGELISEKDLK